MKKMKNWLYLMLMVLGLCGVVEGALPGEVIINEFYWHTTGNGPDHYEAVELLVTKNDVNLNGVRVSDRNEWNVIDEGQCTINDQGKGFLTGLRSGTLLVIFNGYGEDDTDASDYVLKLYAQSSPYCDVGATGEAFLLNDKGDNLHLSQGDTEQLDFIKYRSSDYKETGGGDPGKCIWKGGKDGYIDVGTYRLNTGTRYMGNSIEGNDEPKQWENYIETYPMSNNLGLPNGGPNSDWIQALRDKSAAVSNPSGAKAETSEPQQANANQVIWYQAHRGGVAEMPENTLAAYRYSWNLGGIPEADIGTTSDGVFICLHDATLARTTNAPDAVKNIKVSELTFKEIRKWDAGVKFSSKYAGEKVPALTEVFAEMQNHPERQVYLDLKELDLKKLGAMIEKYGVGRQVIFCYKDQEKLVEFRNIAPGVRTMLWIGGKDKPEQIKMKFEQALQTGFKSLDQVQLHLHRVKSEQDRVIYQVEPAYLQYALQKTKAAGIQLQVLPFEFDEASLRNLLDIGIRWYATDYPQKFVSVVNRWKLGDKQAAPAWKGKEHSAVISAHRHNWWSARHEQVLDQIKGKVDLIFVGDSITHGWEKAGKELWDKYYAPRNAVNMGFSGDRTQHVLWRFEHGEIDGISPKLAILMIGTNNSNKQDNTAEEIADGIKAICAQMRWKLPKTKILILSIFPRGEKPSPQREKNAKASELAAQIADNDMIYYLNINDKFLEADGTLSTDIMPDLLHPNEKGYKIWAEAIEPTVAKLMGEN
ncbi:MAG: hypothetical protein JXD22_08420 [Sedimentisphaerales bacterium]|nr:hypothetical protein [Sedimentisphaerales bacterium]